jgi:hypothetical protein
MKTYTIYVSQFVNFYQPLEVVAEDEEDARKRAEENFECDWNCAEGYDFETTVLRETSSGPEAAVSSVPQDEVSRKGGGNRA